MAERPPFVYLCSVNLVALILADRFVDEYDYNFVVYIHIFFTVQVIVCPEGLPCKARMRTQAPRASL